MSKTIYINARFLTQKTTGVQRFAIEISKILIKLNSDIKFIAPKNIISNELAIELGVETFGRFTGHLWEQIELPLFLKSKGNPLFINFCNTAPLFYNNQIVTIHDLAFIINPKWFSKKFALVYNFLIPRIANRAKHIITVSNSSKNEISELLNQPLNKISVVYNGITFKKSEEIIQTNNEKYFLTVSSIDPRKNLKKLIEAFTIWNNNDIKLFIVGGTSNNFNDQSWNYDESKIKFLGYVTDEELNSYYRNAQCFVYPSLYEGFGLPPLEAMAFGTNVIVSDIPSVREVCQENALAYFNPNSIESIIEALDFALENKITVKPIDYEEFSWSNSAKKIQDLIIYHN